MNIEQIAMEVADELFLDKITIGRNSAEFLRRCLQKFAEQADMEPVGEVRCNYSGQSYISWPYASWMTHNHGTNLFTEAQLLAAQQKAAEATWKAMTEGEDYEGAMSNWREYL